MGEPNNHIFISDLPAEVDDATLAEVFGQYGTVVWSKVMTSKGKPTNAAIVEFASVEEAQYVVENLNGNLAQGIATPLNIAFKQEKSKGKGGGKGKETFGKAAVSFGKANVSFGKASNGYSNGKSSYGKVASTPLWSPKVALASSPYGNGKAGGKGGDGGKGPAKPNTNLFISDLPVEIDDAKLAEVFGQYGTVTWSKVIANKGKPTSAAIVEFESLQEAQWVVENLNGNLAQGIATPLTIAFKRERSKGKW